MLGLAVMCMVKRNAYTLVDNAPLFLTVDSPENKATLLSWRMLT